MKISIATVGSGDDSRQTELLLAGVMVAVDSGESRIWVGGG